MTWLILSVRSATAKMPSKSEPPPHNEVGTPGNAVECGNGATQCPWLGADREEGLVALSTLVEWWSPVDEEQMGRTQVERAKDGRVQGSSTKGRRRNGVDGNSQLCV